MNIQSHRLYTITVRIIMLYAAIFCSINSIANHQAPRLTIVIVVDQFSYNAIQQYNRYLNFGLKTLLSRGVNYTNAYHPHALPATATGHAALSTGTYAQDHGIICNSWFDENNNPVHASDDTVEAAAVFSPTGTYDDGGISSKLLMVDTLSDQFVLTSNPNKPCYAYALSMKDRAATQMAGKLGKAIWFDKKTGYFTSSKAYFESLPAWVKNFNKETAMDTLKYVDWCQAKPRNSKGYIFAYEQSFEYASLKEGLFNTRIPIEWEKNPNNPFSLFLQTPNANKLLLDFASTCIDTHISKKNNNHLLLWISLSALDIAGHTFGPNSKETIDIIYHLDKQLARFMRHARRIVGQRETLFVLTADHGISPIIENLEKKGVPAHRYSSKDMIKELNNHLHTTHKVKNLITKHASPQFYFDTTKFNGLEQIEQTNLIHEAKLFLLQQPGIKKVWTYQELKENTFDPYSLESYYKHQLYPGRSGQLIVQTMPYYDITEWPTGADHSSPYDYNTHVPLILYQHGSIELKSVGERVFTLQLANTLADILKIPKPSASTAKRLPGIDAEINHLLY